MRNRAEVRIPTVRSRVATMCATMRNRAQPCNSTFLSGEPLRCQPHPMMVFIGTILEGWGSFIEVHFLANKTEQNKTNVEADP